MPGQAVIVAVLLAVSGTGLFARSFFAGSRPHDHCYLVRGRIFDRVAVAMPVCALLRASAASAGRTS